MNFILNSQRNGIYLCQRREIMGRLIQILRTEDSEFEKFLKINGARKEPQLRKFFDAIVSAVDKR